MSERPEMIVRCKECGHELDRRHLSRTPVKQLHSALAAKENRAVFLRGRGCWLRVDLVSSDMADKIYETEDKNEHNNTQRES